MSKNVIGVAKQGTKTQYCDEKGALTSNLNDAKVFDIYSKAVNAAFEATVKYEAQGYAVNLMEVEG